MIYYIFVYQGLCLINNKDSNQNIPLRMKAAKSYKLMGFASSILFCCLLLNGCAIFRKKNKCLDCPKWSKVEMGRQYSIKTHYQPKHADLEESSFILLLVN